MEMLDVSMNISRFVYKKYTIHFVAFQTSVCCHCVYLQQRSDKSVVFNEFIIKKI